MQPVFLKLNRECGQPMNGIRVGEVTVEGRRARKM
jgi:hypothetical protein